MTARIMVVEDDVDILDLVVFILEGQGYAVISAGGASEALAGITNARPDLFLIDLMLPDTTGVDLAVWLRKSGFADTPMIAMTASLHVLPDAERAGVFDDIVAKPFDLHGLLERVQEFTSRTGACDT